jgi:hypothetical protein
MEGERYQELAVKLGYTHYMELCVPQHIEKVLRDSLEIKKIAEPEAERSNLAYEQQRFVWLCVCVRALRWWRCRKRAGGLCGGTGTEKRTERRTRTRTGKGATVSGSG